MNFAGSPSTSADTRTAAGQAPSPSVKKEPSTQVHPGTQVHRSPNPSHDDTDGATTLSNNGRHSTAPPSLTRPQSAAPAPTSKLSMSPGKIVAGAMHNRKPTGGLKKAMSMYQENKRQLTKVQREKSASPGNGYGTHGVGGPEKQWLRVSQLDARVTVSAGKWYTTLLILNCSFLRAHYNNSVSDMPSKQKHCNLFTMPLIWYHTTICFMCHP